MVKVLRNTQPKIPMRISVRLPHKMVEKVTAALKTENLSSKDRSRWIEDAILKLSQQSYYWLFIQEDWIDKGDNKTIQILVNTHTNLQITKMSEETQAKVEDTPTELKSAIIRTAIIQKLLSHNTQHGGVM